MLPVAMAVVTLMATHKEKPILERVPKLQEIHQRARSGELGCGSGTIKLATSRGVVSVPTGLDPIHVFGGTVKTEDLLTLLKSRAESNRTGKRGPMSGQGSDLCALCLSLLEKSKETDAIPVLTELLTDADDTIRGLDATALYGLGDTDKGLRADIRRCNFPSWLSTAREGSAKNHPLG